MRAFYRKTIASCFSLVVLFLTIGPAAAADIVEIRGPVYNGSTINDIVTKEAIRMDATQFAAFYYETDPNIITENLTVK